ncbi:hypothetical protein PV10_04954 [Exophiala mesophila]|uniref:NmrA-like domain-containing protein n=1 Tax=Exophiala mesophila TaxID=212818 RepID=A0A0D2A435_EXOME|nr:uncharacterized protein PV10_04954 [Exophiala mesophila]KIV93763.1 hypothetical protein PV10_04954 [Exophiala mesophila]
MSSAGGFVPKKLLIVGATGLVGSRITDAIVKNRDSFERVAIFTSPSTAQSKAEVIERLKKEGVAIIEGDVTKTEDIQRAFQDVDTVISAVGRNAIESQIEMVRIADESPSVRRFFPSEYGTDIEHGPGSAVEKPHQKKLQVRAAIRGCKNLEHTYVVSGPYADGEPGLYFGASPFKEAGNFDVKNKEATLIEDGQLKISFTTMKDVGKLVVLALKHPDASKNRALRVNSFTTCDKEILGEFEKQTGGQAWKVTYTSLDKLKQLEQEAWNNGVPYATVFTLRRIWAEGGTLYEARDNHLIEADEGMETLADAVAEAIRVQTAAS